FRVRPQMMDALISRELREAPDVFLGERPPPFHARPRLELGHASILPFLPAPLQESPRKCENGGMIKAYAARSAASRLEPFELERREPGPKDVEIEIAYCGICHSDIHMVRNEWGGSSYPIVP